MLSAAEEAGQVRRGYFVDGLGASQFAVIAAVERLRAIARRTDRVAHPQEVLVLAATDPANPYGTFLPWPRPADPGVAVRSPRKAGSSVVLIEGELVLYVERAGQQLITYTARSSALTAAARALAALVRSGRFELGQVEHVDGRPALGSDHVMVQVLLEAGFRATPKGLRLRR
ncbi:Lhr family helicase [Austwickia chelonae]|uniref:Lhr family helicase n=1 Tax=Austwickia chelonae TaxID=100225 RepID=UPI003D317EFD